MSEITKPPAITDPQSLPGAGTVTPVKEIKAVNADGQAAGGMDKLLESADGAGAKDPALSAQPSSTGATGSAAPE